MNAAELLASERKASKSSFFNGTSRPYVRWWWLSGPFHRDDITRQLRWVKDNGFGGVELAWIFPRWLEDDAGQRPHWLNGAWAELAAFTKLQADELGLGCDFTLGSCWPFGGSWLTEADAAKTFAGLSEQRLQCSWEQETFGPQFVLDHLSSGALSRYAKPLLQALRPALAGSRSALFCDSLEIETRELWSPRLWQQFEEQYGYPLQNFAHNLDMHPDVRYDYRKLVGETIFREFYEAFNSVCHDVGAYARVQCHGAPTDLLAAYAAVDVPESEALLFLPSFSRIAASAAAWAGKPVVSAETFTCIYGFPGWDDTAEEYWRRETIGDLKLLADAVFANGVNQIVWHGMPFQQSGKSVEFYASVHVGPDSVFAPQLLAFNRYLESVSSVLKLGYPYAGLGVYLPNEDAIMLDTIPDDERTPGANYVWEMRHAAPPEETCAFHPLWISHSFLREARVEEGLIVSREVQVPAVYVDCEWLDADSLAGLLRLAKDGARLVVKRPPQQPGHKLLATFTSDLNELSAQPNVTRDINGLIPLLSGRELPEFAARVLDQRLILFVAHPFTQKIRYPMHYGLSNMSESISRDLILNWMGQTIPLELRFEPGESLLLVIDGHGVVKRVDLRDPNCLQP